MKRLMIRLPDPAHAALQARAQQAGEPLASTASGLLRTVLEDNETTTSRRARLRTRPASPPRAKGAGAPWIAPEDDPDWHTNMWGMIVALYERYPRALAKLEHDWYEHPERVETLAALAYWRANIDTSAEDPREELAFHNALQQLARILDQTPGLGRPFKAGTTMPVEWSGSGAGA
jgi:hypothetical protein